MTHSVGQSSFRDIAMATWRLATHRADKHISPMREQASGEHQTLVDKHKHRHLGGVLEMAGATARRAAGGMRLLAYALQAAVMLRPVDRLERRRRHSCSITPSV